MFSEGGWDSLRAPQPHLNQISVPSCLRVLRVNRAEPAGWRDDEVLLYDRAPRVADVDRLGKPEDDRRLALVPVDVARARLLGLRPALAPEPRHPAVHHDDQHVVAPRREPPAG